ncbi:MAG: tetratricopeptide repeat protein, partial [Ignavibacteriaceae bacterium]|nr:tetratricopeptide repeat protein [Ignavibacteriaceae bacterium]
MVKFKELLIVILILFFTGAFAQSIRDTDNVSIRFNKAVQLFDSSKFEDAYRIFDDIIAHNVFNSYTTISYIFDGKSLLNVKKYEDGKIVLYKFLEKYPDSKYIDEAKITLAQIFTEQQDFSGAFDVLISLIDTSSSPFYIKYSKTNAEKIAINYLSVSRLKVVYDSLAGKKAKPFDLLLLGKFYLKNDNKKEARNTLSELLKLYPESEEKGEAATLYNNIEANNHLDGSPLIAALLPLNMPANSEDYKTISEILEGIKFAFSEFNNQSDKKVGLLIENTERNKEQIEKLKNDLVKLPMLKA